MPPQNLTPEEYELHLQDLAQRLREFADTGQGDSSKLMREAEELFELSEDYPEVFHRHEDLQGLVAALLARKQQEKYRAGFEEREKRRAPGCLLGWLFGGTS
jgi:hypothetical protein